MRFTRASTPGTVRRRARVGTVAVVDTPIPSAMCCQRARPTINPAGMPTASPTTARVVCLPHDGGPGLPAIEAERLEETELSTAASRRGDERMSDGEERETAQQRREGRREPVDLAEAGDLDGNGGSGQVLQSGNRGDTPVDGSPVGSGRIAPDPVGLGPRRIEERIEARPRERGAVGEGLGVSERGEHGLADDPVPDLAVPAAAFARCCCATTVSPIVLPNAWRVTDPSATSSGPHGTRPETTAGGIVPRIFVKDHPPTGRPSSWMF